MLGNSLKIQSRAVDFLPTALFHRRKTHKKIEELNRKIKLVEDKQAERLEKAERLQKEEKERVVKAKWLALMQKNDPLGYQQYLENERLKQLQSFQGYYHSQYNQQQNQPGIHSIYPT